MPQLDPTATATATTALATFGTIIWGWGGERVLRAIPAFPYVGEGLRAFVAVVTFLSLFFALLANWAQGTLSANDLTGLGAAFAQAFAAVAILLAVYRGKSPQAYRRAVQAEQAEANRISWHP